MKINTTVKNCKIRSDLRPDDEVMMKTHLTAFTGGEWGGVQEQMMNKTDYGFVMQIQVSDITHL